MSARADETFVTDLCGVCLEVTATHHNRCNRCARRLCRGCTRRADKRDPQEELYCVDCVAAIVDERMAAADEAWLIGARAFLPYMKAFEQSYELGMDRRDPFSQLGDLLRDCIHFAIAERNGAQERLGKRRVAARRRRITPRVTVKESDTSAETAG